MLYREINATVWIGKVHSIGVSNFSIKNLETLLEHTKVVSANNQVEMHPYKEKGILVTANSPLAAPVVL